DDEELDQGEALLAPQTLAQLVEHVAAPFRLRWPRTYRRAVQDSAALKRGIEQEPAVFGSRFGRTPLRSGSPLPIRVRGWARCTPSTICWRGSRRSMPRTCTWRRARLRSCA